MRHELETVVSVRTPVIDLLMQKEQKYIHSFDAVLQDYNIVFEDRKKLYDSVNDLMQIKDAILDCVASLPTPVIDRLMQMEQIYIHSIDAVLQYYNIGFEDKKKLYDSVNDLIQIKDAIRDCGRDF